MRKEKRLLLAARKTFARAVLGRETGLGVVGLPVIREDHIDHHRIANRNVPGVLGAAGDSVCAYHTATVGGSGLIVLGSVHGGPLCRQPVHDQAAVYSHIGILGGMGVTDPGLMDQHIAGVGDTPRGLKPSGFDCSTPGLSAAHSICFVEATALGAY
ncbi:MAG TPA: hypothetical protein VH186_08480 [Chloroflexia bacterium]|nr:hypothetical protein [Chloroflexia bacterium]